MTTVRSISIVIPCRNEENGIQHFLTSLLHQDIEGFIVEYLIADGMSSDGTREVLARLQKELDLNAQDTVPQRQYIRLIDNPGRIASTGLNAAIRAARGDIIIRMDAHSEYAPDYLRRCVEVHDRTCADNVGGPWIARGTSTLASAIAAAFQSPFAMGRARGHDPHYEGEVDTVYLGCWRRDVFQKFGHFDEDLVRNQDDEHNLRIIRGGGRIWQSPQIRSWYRPRDSLPRLVRQYMQYGYWKVRVIQKHKVPASCRHLVPAAFVLATVLLSLVAILIPATAGPLVLWSRSALIILVSTYALACVVASLITAAKTEWVLLPFLPLVFPCFQISYGIGFLCGVWDFLIRRRNANRSFETLTR